MSANVSTDPAGLRNALRTEKIAAREALSPGTHAHYSAALENHLAALLSRCELEILGFCWPYRAEFDCRAIATQWITQGVRACLPLVSEREKIMQFREWRPESIMVTDRYGIHYPASGDMLHPDLLLIPVNVFDAQGFRLGYGKGHFDHTLASLVPRPLAIGVGFELARAASIFPQAHDIPMDAVVTENGTECFSQRARTLAR